MSGVLVAEREVERLLTPSEVGLMFRVDPRTVVRWAKAGRLPALKTPGGHRRFREFDVAALVAGKELPERDERGRLIEGGWPDATGSPEAE